VVITCMRTNRRGGVYLTVLLISITDVHAVFKPATISTSTSAELKIYHNRCHLYTIKTGPYAAATISCKQLIQGNTCHGISILSSLMIIIIISCSTL